MRTGAKARFLAALGLWIAIGPAPLAKVAAQGEGDAGGFSAKTTTEPVMRVSRVVEASTSAAADAATARHSLDPALQLAYEGLDRMRSGIHDYTATLVKRERIDGRLSDEEFIQLKIRNARVRDGLGQVPFSIYLRFLRPTSCEGREVIWVDGRNDGKLVAHDTGVIRGQFRVSLDPEGGLAMKGNRYPIYEAGIENLVVRLIEKANRDRAAGDCRVSFRNAKVGDRECTKITVQHDERRHPYDFHIAEVFIDKELGIPIRYAAYTWPRRPDEEPILEEEYTYTNVRLNVGLTDRDFDPDNPAYAFP
ncbi:MAG TPA: hypothetical protein DCQ98_10220 [Planctomycetaceae bacterium]|nr:hypothetical protein [Planctomycetaceae bacterium]